MINTDIDEMLRILLNKIYTKRKNQENCYYKAN